MIGPDHPFWITREIIERYGTSLQFELGEYQYRKDALDDTREYILISATDATPERIEDLIRELTAGHELALHSRVHFDEDDFLHIPMIDFCGFLLPESRDRMKKYLPHGILDTLRLFDSGSSYHAYSTELLSQETWIEFMGKILLLNSPGENPFVDTRWVGHRLIGGFGSLRWSWNTPQYKKIPTRVEQEGFFRPANTI